MCLVFAGLLADARTLIDRARYVVCIAKLRQHLVDAEGKGIFLQVDSFLGSKAFSPINI